MEKLDLGELCIFCHNTTEPGSGRFTNRIPAETDLDEFTLMSGYACELCYTGETDRLTDELLSKEI